MTQKDISITITGKPGSRTGSLCKEIQYYLESKNIPTERLEEPNRIYINPKDLLNHYRKVRKGKINAY